MIRCLYIKCADEEDSYMLNYILNEHEYPFYDATASEALCNKPTLEDIEIQYEGK